MKNSPKPRSIDAFQATKTRIEGIHNLSDSLRRALVDADRLGLTKVGIHIQDAWTSCEAAKLENADNKEG
ncbi:hypothetical protein GRI44_02540 [Altererythrobacter confluentis]|uniref:Uncharacterized protein n=1 Tax=Allopontixanthobacter confluentis TaxID=1849021 RepID=A0A6L7GG28_9SPHN|nr:hypothetical protein [Allopontixanthobacter confluentis]MXP13631.1 hypothetical protein [Allopontixanthobacter confluentis]